MLACLALLVLVPLGVARAHDFRPALLQLGERPDAPGSYDLRLLIPATSTTGPIGEGELTPLVPEHCTLAWRSPISARLDCGEQGLVGVLGLDGLEQHPVDVVIEIRHLDGTRISAVLAPGDPPLLLGGAGPRRGALELFNDYVVLGIEHILAGIDHLLFVLGLVLLIRERTRGVGAPRLKGLLWTVTAFTLAHSLTLVGSTLGWVALPSPPVEAGIALSILLLARELLVLERDTLTWRAPWLVAFGFGLLHGFGFAGALADVGLPADRVPLALLAFNLGVEVGQLAVVAVLMLAFVGLRRMAERLDPSERTRTLARALPIYAMGSLAFAWTLERVLSFWQ
jgi:hydrogenase/urease accessory protein HupE